MKRKNATKKKKADAVGETLPTAVTLETEMKEEEKEPPVIIFNEDIHDKKNAAPPVKPTNFGFNVEVPPKTDDAIDDLEIEIDDVDNPALDPATCNVGQVAVQFEEG